MFSEQSIFSPNSALGYKNDTILHSFIKKHAVEEHEARLIFQATLQFLVMVVENDTPVSPSSIVDDMWHTFILHTRDYADFCQSHFGRFVHHNPTKSPYIGNRAEVLVKASKTFGEDFNPELWPQVNDTITDCDSSCSGDSYCSGD